MREIQYADAISFDGYQAFIESTRRHDEAGTEDWDMTYATLLEAEGHEFLNQHGHGSLLLLPAEFGVDTEGAEAQNLKYKMVDELGDNLWFAFAIAGHLGESAKELAQNSLSHHSGADIADLNDFTDWQEQVMEHAGNLKVINKIGLYLKDAPEHIRYTTLERNPQYVFMRMHHRLTRALDGGSQDLAPPTATELEPLADPKLAVGDYLNTIAYIGKHNLGWDIEDVARLNAHKLTHRALYGKTTPTP